MEVRLALSLCASLATLLLQPAPAPAEAEQARPKGTFVWVDPVRDLAPDAVASNHISRILFINRCEGGCTLSPGQNDARYDTSSIVSSTSMLSEFQHGEEVFQQVVDCVKDVYSPYDIEVVTEDPVTGDPADAPFHHEAILAGHPEEVGLSSMIAGIAPASCEPLNNVISFSFANLRSEPDVEDMCWTVAQESAHSYGLPSHVFNCLDPMTYLRGPCGRKYFRDALFPCGEFEEAPCNCGGSVQNSHRELRATFGDGTPPPPPDVEILHPATDGSVVDGFTVYADAQDPRQVFRLEFYVNGTKYGELEGHPYAQRHQNYRFNAPSLPDGYLDLEVRAYNDLGSEGIATARVLKGAPCTSADSCFDFQECVDGACYYPPATGEFGDDCEYDQYCVTGQCPSVGGDRLCSRTCAPGLTGDCPQGFECAAGDSGNVCWPEGHGGGCCTVAGGTQRREIPWALALLFAAAVLALRRRSPARPSTGSGPAL